jgi:hypothetical protein
MRRLERASFSLCLIAVGLTLSPAAADEPPRSSAAVVAAVAGPIVATHHRANAPADEYFGRFKMSILGVRNVVSDIDARADDAAADAARNLCHKLTLAEDALRDWHAKYPDDTWLPKLGYTMLADYQKLDADLIDDEAQVARLHAIDLATWLEEAYPNFAVAPEK